VLRGLACCHHTTTREREKKSLPSPFFVLTREVSMFQGTHFLHTSYIFQSFAPLPMSPKSAALHLKKIDTRHF
jgi:hypothetical protein